MIETSLKETDLGMIPQDWRIISLGDVGEVQMCKRILKEQTTPKGDIPFYKIGTFGKCPDAFISKELFEEYKLGFNYPRKGDILLSAAGTIGRTVIFDGTPSYFQDSNIVWIANDRKRVVNELLYYLYDTFNWITETGTIPRIYNNTVRSIRFAIPDSLDEQRAIAEALSDIDKLIAALDKKIEKQKMIKQGVMQELLTGKRRLEGFSEPWVTTRFGDNYNIVMGQSPSSSYYNSNQVGLPLIQGNADIENRRQIVRFYTSQITKVCDANDVILSVRAPVGAVGIAKHRSCLGRGVCAIKTENNFLFHYLVYNEDKWQQDSKGSTFDSINSVELKNKLLYVPSSTAEQIAIASIFDDYDKEIHALVSKREKFMCTKKGMMQQLLTGKIRLIDSLTLLT